MEWIFIPDGKTMGPSIPVRVNYEKEKEAKKEKKEQTKKSQKEKEDDKEANKKPKD